MPFAKPALSGKEAVLRPIETVLLAVIGVMALVYVVLWLGGLATEDVLFDVSNIAQTGAAFISAGICLRRSYRARSFPFFLSIGLALSSWVMGNIFWFSYAHMFSQTLLYPSIGEFGFLGYYLLILGGLTYQIRSASGGLAPSQDAWWRYLPFLLLVVPLVVVWNSGASILESVYTAVFVASMVFTLYQMAAYRFGRHYWPLFGGIGLTMFADVFFVLDASVFKPESTYWRGPFWVVGFGLMAYGVIRLRRKEKASLG